MPLNYCFLLSTIVYPLNCGIKGTPEDLSTHLLFLDEIHEVGPLDLHRLTLPVVQSQDEVEKVGLAQVRGRLLLKVSPGQTHSAADTHAGTSRCQKRAI